MMRFAVLFLALLSAEAFTPALHAPGLRLRSTGPTRLSMAEQRSETSVLSKAALGAAVAGALFAGPVFVDASINSQMSMNSESFSVLVDNQKKYDQKSRTVNPYASQEEQLVQLEKIARLEECQLKNTVEVCEARETQRSAQMRADEAQSRKSPLTFAVPILVTTGISALLVKFLNK
mmetsp:Transcript_22265/g.56167  ORF Transcript_22265/g.56167 Transcript_22265/m.56167 type:complete len:177 (-) Transcript_22265:63-593(-)|eukprot:CAMPEP_0174925314 /NCGR_PEP_ID=MMETSP1355-20121228/7820_1 /TAXON_ID=464990 /ORGANISM="Hemiselmis tepida, Strain CCMP443" /LENGTH=176 /DNA_ID=CAMNT_0016171209 /DNA_START=68 /DNA_END=598 /DNA_ORIENTATION=+